MKLERKMKMEETIKRRLIEHNNEMSWLREDARLDEIAKKFIERWLQEKQRWLQEKQRWIHEIPEKVSKEGN